MIDAVRESLLAPLNARELAFAIWAPIVAAIAALFPKIRAWVAAKLSSFGHRETLAWWLVVLLFSAAVVLGLESIGLWSLTMLRPTFLWMLLVPGAVALGLANHAERRYTTAVGVSLVVFEVLFGIQPLPFWMEIGLWPLYGIAAIVSGVALGLNRKALGHGIHVVIKLVTLAILGHSVWALVVNWNEMDKLLLAFPVFMAAALLVFQRLIAYLELRRTPSDTRP